MIWGGESRTSFFRTTLAGLRQSVVNLRNPSRGPLAERVTVRVCVLWSCSSFHTLLRYFPELPLELEPEAPVPVLPIPPAPVFEVGLPIMVWPDVFLLGAKTEWKSCRIPCMVLQPVRLIPIKLIAKSLEA